MKRKGKVQDRRALFRARFRKTLKEVSFYLVLCALALSAVPDMLPHLDALLSTFMGENLRKALTEILILLGLVARLIPGKVKEKVLRDLDLSSDSSDDKDKGGKG